MLTQTRLSGEQAERLAKYISVSKTEWCGTISGDERHRGSSESIVIFTKDGAGNIATAGIQRRG